MSHSSPVPTPESRRDTLKQIFADALEFAPGERHTFITSVTAITTGERDELLRLLNFSEATDYFDNLSRQIGSLAGPRYAFEPGDVADRRFRIRRFIAAGGMGEVYEAEHLELGGLLALKVLRPALSRDAVLVETFRREIRLARDIVSHNICNVFDVGRHQREGYPDIVFYTMEYLDGETLRARIHREGPLPAGLAREVIRQLLDGLSAAHRAQVLHRDFKSGNVILCADGNSFRAVITDFGIAKRLTGEDDVETGPHTPSSAAAEQLDRLPETRATDIYAFGVVMYEIVTGKPPFHGRTRGALVPPRSANPDISRQWESVLLRCLEPDPRKRYAEFSEVRRALGLDEPQRPERRSLLAAFGAVMIGGSALAGFRSVHHPAATRHTIAVMPFEWDSPIPSDPGVAMLPAALADRMTDLLIRLPGLRVVSRVAAAAALIKTKAISAAAREVSAQSIIMGRIRAAKSPGVYNLHLELADVASGTMLWSETNTGNLSELEAVYRNAARSVADVLRLDRQRAALPSNAGTGNSLAWQNYLLARYHADQRDNDSLDRAVSLCRQAIQLDPYFAAAHSWLGYCLFYTISRNGSDRVQLLADAEAGAGRSLALDNSDADAHTVFGLAHHFFHWSWSVSEQHFRQAIALSPSGSLGHHRYARLLGDLGRFPEALQESDTALDLDPQSSSVRIGRGIILTNAGRYAEAVALLESLAGSDPGHFNVYVPLSNAYVAAARLEDALRAAREAVQKSGRMSFALSQEGYVLALLGDKAAARAHAAELESRYREHTADPGEVAGVYAGLQEVDATLEWLERGIPSRSSILSTIRTDLLFRFLSGHPRYDNLLRTVGLFV